MFSNYSPPNRPENVYYLQPARKITSQVWFSCVPVGRNTLAKTIPRLCKMAGISGYHTNHSLRSAAATRLYAEGVDEQLIAEKTGHRSVAVRSYKVSLY